MGNISKTINYMKRNGIKDTFFAAKERLELKRSTHYTYVAPTDEELCAQKLEAESMGISFSVVMPAYETPEVFLKEAIDSILAQSYPSWELIIVDASTDDKVKKTIEQYENTEYLLNSEDKSGFRCGKIVYMPLSENLGISDNTNAGIDLASGDYVALFDHDDLYTPDALFWLAKAIEDAKTGTDSGDICDNTAPLLIYTDEDKYDSESGLYYDAHRKYDFNYDYLLSNNYICHISCVRRDIFEKIRLNSEFDGAQDYDLVLEVAAHAMKNGQKNTGVILHVPRICYHWRCHAESTASNVSSKLYAYEAGLKALQKHVDNLYLNKDDSHNQDSKQDVSMTAKHSKHLGFYQITYAFVDDNGSTGTSAEAVFAARADVGAVIGRSFDKKGHMLPIMWNENDEFLFAGMNRFYAGEFNRFDSAQDVVAADYRYMKIRPALAQKYPDIMGILEREKENVGYTPAKWHKLCYELCSKMAADGFRILYIPEL